MATLPPNSSRTRNAFLETGRLHLERPTEGDGATLTGLWRNEQVQAFLGGAVSERVAGERFAEILAHWHEHGYGMCVVRRKSSGEPVGLCGLSRLGEEVEVAYKFWPRCWGSGYATEAATSCLGYGLRVLHLERIVGIMQEANAGSQRVLEKIGMSYERGVVMWGSPQRMYAVDRYEWKEAEASR